MLFVLDGIVLWYLDWRLWMFCGDVYFLLVFCLL